MMTIIEYALYIFMAVGIVFALLLLYCAFIVSGARDRDHEKMMEKLDEIENKFDKGK